MQLRSLVRLLAVLAIAFALANVPRGARGQGTGFNPALPLTHVDNGPNSDWAERQHYVVLVSLDGFRWDYPKRDDAVHLLALGKRGVWAPEGMVPSYPSLTFPNHFTLVTGLYPEHTGIVANNFLDPASGRKYSYTDESATTDGSWYSGVPLWSLAESHGMRTACLLWITCNTRIAGFRPSWYAHYDASESTPESQQARIDDTIALLREPVADRPHLIAIYFSEPDHSGHKFGPDAPETRAAALKMDAIVGKLETALKSTGLPIDLVIVSDHGMIKAEGDWIDLDQFADLTGFDTVGSLLYGKTEEARERVYNQLKHASSEFVAYRLKNVPANLNYNQNPREGDPVVIAIGPYAIRAHLTATGDDSHPHPIGMHGFDPHIMPEMKAIFFAAGPDLLPGKTVAPFENVNLYPWLAHMLGLDAPKSDGSLNILSGTLRDGGVTAESAAQ
ncbi:MAG TPA: ectonucleotide pyrophosphatase/phosphodiesterase [Terracidiphilus sp.]|nr:ectonucleotide pyrophosphatase/phosphodiesterase [Terracidiphilus sp.]